MAVIHAKQYNEVPRRAFLDHPMSTGLETINNLINGDGPLRGQVITVDAPRGSGKTTMLLQVLDNMAGLGKKVLYISREEPDFQLRKTGDRIGLSNNINIVGDDEDVYLEDIVDTMPMYDMVVIDSYSCLKSRIYKGDEARMKALKSAAKEEGIECCVMLILHQTKGGQSAGSREIEQLCDTVVKMTRCDEDVYGSSNIRKIEVTKNRFGPLNSVIMALGEDGWGFDCPLEEITEKPKKKDSPQAKKADEREAILAFIRDRGSLTLSDLSNVVAEDDRVTHDRHIRHLKHMEVEGVLMKDGRGQKASWKIAA
jgi:predicted ATP-dependent serine protease